MEEKRLNITVILKDEESRVELYSDTMTSDELAVAGLAAVKVTARSVSQKLNKRERRAFLSLLSKFVKSFEKEVK